MRSLVALTCGALLLLAAPAFASFHSELALATMGGDDHPELVLAQRAIERSWGPSDDSVYVELEIPDWKSESIALGLSAAIPGLGQAYAGDRRRGFLFAATEVAAWVSRELYRRRGNELNADAEKYVGKPDDPGSTWSFERWSQATQADPSELETLYQADREVFRDLIGSDPRFLAGWSGNAALTRQTYTELRRHASNRLSSSRWATAALWVNHAIAAFDAVRAARLHNMPLRPNVDLRVRGSWHKGPGIMATVEGRF